MMNEVTTFDYLAIAMAISAITVGVVEAIKRAGLATRWSPFAAMLVGVGFAFVFDWSQEDAFLTSHIGDNLLAGVVAGLMASGLYSGVTTLAGRGGDAHA